ncbi:MAG: phenylalanine--tRNA ligase subunit beta [Methanotrichaceae archaeon]|nr:phenylalanine--tRNA ligase subunit beta [Methanotrichaceae archaeon]
MPVVRLYYEDLEQMVGASRDYVMNRIAMMGADIGKIATETYVDVEFFPDRPDLFSSEGVARALQGFLGIKTGLREYQMTFGNILVEVEDSVKDVRPIIGCAVVRGLEFSNEAIESLMNLQEDLHWGLGRNRRKVAIGVHDISRVKPPFRYLGADPEHKFVPLDFTSEMSMRDILKKHPKGIEFGHILADFKRYPLILDANNAVLSFPPIINGELTRVRDDTHDLFIDVTGTDPVVHKTLNIVVTSLAERGGIIESVHIKDDKSHFISPNLAPSKWTIRAEEANALIGFQLSSEELAECLSRMRFGVSVVGDKVEVQVPAYRADVMHSWDIFEDAAKGYGYDKLLAELPRTVTIGKPHPIEIKKAEIREIMSGLGYLETMPFTLTNEEIHFHKMKRRPIEVTRIMHPISELHNIIRISILPTLMEIFSLNQHHPLPQRIFALGEVVENGKTKINLAAASIHSAADFSEIRSVVDAILREMIVETSIKPSEDAAFMPGRGADLIAEGRNIGCFGELHPEVIRAFNLEQPIAALELRLGDLQGAWIA